MPAIVISDLSFSWPDGVPVFSNLNLSFGPTRTGVIGRNGTGKSTLFRLILGELAPASGSVRVNGDIARLPQTLTLRARDSVADLLGIGEKVAALRAIQAGSTDAERFAVVGDDWDVEERALAVLERLRLFPHLRGDADALLRPVGTLSGGEAMAAALVGIVLRRPAVALLDEPTNNLDADARGWLYETVERWRGTLLVASHDRELLERMDAVAEIRNGGVKLYGGNFSLYLEQSTREREAAERRVRDAESTLRREKRQRADAQTQASRSRAQGVAAIGKKRFPTAVTRQRKSDAEAHGSRERTLREERIAEAADSLRQAKAEARTDDVIAVDLPETTVPAGKLVLSLAGAEKSFAVHGPERIVLSGRNGAGKTTLLRALLGQAVLPSLSVESIVPEVGYLPQRLDFLDDRLDAMENLRAFASGLSVNAAHARLAQFLFRGGRARAAAGTLSGGERLPTGFGVRPVVRSASAPALAGRTHQQSRHGQRRGIDKRPERLSRRSDRGQPRQAIPGIRARRQGMSRQWSRYRQGRGLEWHDIIMLRKRAA